MSISTARSFLSEACYGEQELDANSALMELDKGALARLLASFSMPLIRCCDLLFCVVSVSGC